MYSKLRLIFILFLMSILEVPELFATEEEKKEKKEEPRLPHELDHVGWDIRCKLQPNTWDCSGNNTVEHNFYFDLKMQACKTFANGLCDLNYNTFSTLDSCFQRCSAPGRYLLSGDDMNHLTWGTICRLQYDFGTCDSYNPMYYYNLAERKCKTFAYSGCGGNFNRFETDIDCFNACDAAVPMFKIGTKFHYDIVI